MNSNTGKSKNGIFKRAAVIMTTAVVALAMMWGGSSASAAAPQNTAANTAAIGTAATDGISLPVKTNYGGLKWQKSFGSGYSHSATPPILAGGHLFTAAGKTLYELNKNTGKVISTCALDGSVEYATIAPQYDDGVIYVPISDWRVQAVGVSSSGLTDKWTASKIADQQAITPITVADGHVYYGTYYSDYKEGYFVCLDSSTGETLWTNSHTGGYYWSGAYVTSNGCVITGSKAGSGSRTGTLYASLYMYDASTGETLGHIDNFSGSISSGIVYDNGYVYYSCKNGRLFKTAVTGKSFGDTTSVSLGASSTCTPVISGSNIYVGTASAIKAISISDLKVTGSASVPAEVNNIMTYEGSSGSTYIYATYNTPPGGIWLAKFGSDGTAGYSRKLFTPTHGQYCISSIVSDGTTLYYKNDSGYLMAVTDAPNPVTAKLKAGKKKITVSWKKVTGAEGYIIYRSTSKSGTYKKRAYAASSKKAVYVDKGLKKGRKYYYRIKSRRTVSGSKVYSIYSATKSCKAK